MSQADPNIITGSTAPGGSTMQASEDAHKAAATSNAGTTEPTYKDVGTPWLDTTGGAGSMTYKIYNGSSWVTIASSI